jgi:glycosyltransferase involved in cell wall biosynthesis
MKEIIKSSSITIVIPAHNEEESIGLVLHNIKRIDNAFNIVVVNDGSSDKTKEVANKAGVSVIDLSNKSGVGYALRQGFKAALENKKCMYVIQMDADGQHHPNDLKLLIKEMNEGRGDVVIGSRYVESSTYYTPLLRLIGINVFSILINAMAGKKIHDPTSGFRIYNRKAASFILDNICGKCPEALTVTRLLTRGYKISEIPVNMRQRQLGKSKLTFLIGIWCVLSNVFLIVVKSRR